MEAVEETQSSLATRVTYPEHTQALFHKPLITLLLQQDGENRSRRKNIRLWGLLEGTLGPDLKATLIAIFNKLLNLPPTEGIEIDKSTQSPGPPQ